jgi:uncharacterized iron-regulated membrane protein
MSGTSSAGAIRPARAQARVRRASLYRWLRRIHLAVALVTALPLLVTSITGALLVYGHEIDALIDPPATVVPAPGAPLAPAALIARVQEQRPDAAIWAVVRIDGNAAPWRMWLAGGAGVLEVDPWRGTIVDAYDPGDIPVYGVVRAVHRRWLVNGAPYSGWARTSVSIIALALMVQIVLGVWLWAVPPRRLHRLKPVYRGNRRLLVQRLHQGCGVAMAALLLVIAFTGMSMYWQDSTRAIVETVLGSMVDQPATPDSRGLAPVGDLDAAIALARAAFPESELVSFRPPDARDALVHV